MRQRRWKPKVKQLHEDEQPGEPRLLDPEKARARTMQRAVKLLAAKPRSIGELRERLLEKKSTNESVVDAVIKKLVEYGYLDDQRFAVGYASSQVRQKPVGLHRLQRALQQKLVDQETADEAIRLVFEETPETELIDRAIAKRVRLRGQPKTRAETKSLLDHLFRQGFGFELVTEKVRALAKESVDDERGVGLEDDDVL
jgi:regulatory protein